MLAGLLVLVFVSLTGRPSTIQLPAQAAKPVLWTVIHCLPAAVSCQTVTLCAAELYYVKLLHSCSVTCGKRVKQFSSIPLNVFPATAVHLHYISLPVISSEFFARPVVIATVKPLGRKPRRRLF